MKTFHVMIHPDGLGNPDQSQAFELGTISAENRDEVVALLDAPLEESDNSVVPGEWDFRITEIP